MREMQSACFDGSKVVAGARGWSYDPASDSMSEGEILALGTEQTEEYFDGKKHAKIVSGTQIDTKMIGVTREQSCRLGSTAIKSVDLFDGGTCVFQSVSYDYETGSGTRSRVTDACAAPDSPPDQIGSAVAVPTADVECKWGPRAVLPGMAPEPHGTECTLLPSPVHAGTGRPLVVISTGPAFMRQVGPVIAGQKVTDPASQLVTHQAVRVTRGSAIPAAIFELPVDAASFPVEQ